jgi:L-iditol 2-dehydrogenase
MHGIKSAGLSLGRGALICGAGPIGLIALAAARASGAHPLVITDLEPRRLEFAKRFIPSCQTYQIRRELDAQGNATEIRKLFGVMGVTDEYFAPETVLECTGVENSVVTGAYTCRRGGVLMVIGVGRETMNNLPFMHLSLAEVSIFPSTIVHQDVMTRDSHEHLDRPEIHQPIQRYLACGSAMLKRRYSGFEAPG